MSISRWIHLSTRVAIGAGLGLVLQSGHAQGMTERIERFAGKLVLQDRAVDVTVQTQLITNRQKTPWPTSDATLLVEVRGGRLVAEIDGKRQRYKAGDFWTIPPKAVVVIETEDDSAALAVTAIGAAQR